MRYLPLFIAISICMNTYVLWKMNDPQKAKLLQDSLSSISEDVKQPRAEPKERLETQELVFYQSIDELRSLIEKLEFRVEHIEEQSLSQEAKNESSPVQNGFADTVTASLNSQVIAGRGNEDWFWNSTIDGNDDRTLSFSQADGFNANSIVCRAEWCRVEIEYEIAVDEGVDPEHELQLRIDESLGRDSTIRWGEKEGNRRVIFIQ